MEILNVENSQDLAMLVFSLSSILVLFQDITYKITENNQAKQMTKLVKWQEGQLKENGSKAVADKKGFPSEPLILR